MLRKLLRKVRKKLRVPRYINVYTVWEIDHGACIDTHTFFTYRLARKAYAKMYPKENLCGLCMGGDLADHTAEEWDGAAGHIQPIEVRVNPALGN